MEIYLQENMDQKNTVFGHFMQLGLNVKTAVKHSEFCSHISLENSKLFSIGKLFFVIGSMRGTKIFAQLKQCVLIADKICLNK